MLDDRGREVRVRATIDFDLPGMSIPAGDTEPFLDALRDLLRHRLEGDGVPCNVQSVVLELVSGLAG